MSKNRRPIIAIDGPAGAGKTTAARNVAERLSLLYLDTGATFRALALKAIREEVDLDDEDALAAMARGTRIEFAGKRYERILLDGDDVSEAIREQRVANASSRVAVHATVRSHLVQLWREIGAGGGVVLEGRDIGTVVFPNADLKFFLDAGADERAKRRFTEQSERESVTLDRITHDLEARDEADRSREHSPLRRADDAIRIDTTTLTLQQTLEEILRVAEQRLN